MCGFAMMLALEGRPVDAFAVRKMTATLRHRGPDDEGFYTKGSAGFGFRRLSILDLSPSAHQPMLSDDGQQVLVFNGEIFNYVELREELRALGHSFRSTGDTEVLLRAYQQWGRDCLPRLNGMWAFLLFDQRRQTLFGSRDRFGVKPLYWHRSRERVLFCSELKGILASGYHNGSTNWPVAQRYFAQRVLDEDTQTFFQGIEQVPPGSGFEIGPDGRPTVWRFWSLEGARAHVEEPTAAFFATFKDAVRLRMRSDVPVGVCLSGGLDSTSILAVTSELRREAGAQEPVDAFCYSSPEYDESRYVAETIAAADAQIHQLEIEPRRLWDTLPKALWHWDEPVHSATALIGFELMKLAASRGVKVLLNGQGADETLAGYHSYFPAYWDTLLTEGRPAKAWREIVAYGKAHRHEPWPLFRRAMAQLTGSLWKRPRKPAAAAAIRHSWFTPEVTQGLHPIAAPPSRNLNAVLRFSVEQRRLPLYLRVEDRNSMAHSVEARLPFLDYRLVTLAFNLPTDWKMRGPWNKYVLRQAMRGHIPESVRTRLEKMGFPTSARRWFANEWYTPMRDLLASQATRERGIYRLDVIGKDLDRHRQGQVDVAEALFRIAQFEVWWANRHTSATARIAPFR